MQDAPALPAPRTTLPKCQHCRPALPDPERPERLATGRTQCLVNVEHIWPHSSPCGCPAAVLTFSRTSGSLLAGVPHLYLTLPWVRGQM